MTSKIDLLINSCDRTHGEPEDYRIQLHRPMGVKAIKLKRSIVPNTIHTINANNQMLTVENGSPTTTIVNLAIRAGNYTATELSTYLQTALNAHSELQGTWTVAKNIEDSFRLTITCSIGFTLHFTNENNPHRELGFVNGASYTSEAVVTVQTLYSPNMYKLGYDYLYIVLKGDPSAPIKTDLICLSPTILPLIVFKSSIKNLGSGLPDPKGAKVFTLL